MSKIVTLTPNGHVFSFQGRVYDPISGTYTAQEGWNGLLKYGGLENYDAYVVSQDPRLSLVQGAQYYAAMSGYSLAGFERCRAVRARTARNTFAGDTQGVWLEAEVAVGGSDAFALSLVDSDKVINKTSVGSWVQNPAGGEWTQAAINDVKLALRQKATAELHLFWADLQLDILTQPVTRTITPSYGSTVDRGFRAMWQHTGEVQRSWELKVIKSEEFDPLGSNIEDLPSVYQADSYDSRTSWDVPPTLDYGKDYWLCVRSAVDFNGQLWWGIWNNVKIHCVNRPVISSLVPSGTINYAKPKVAWTVSGALDGVKSSITKVFEEPDSGWPGVFDPETEPAFWQASRVGNVSAVEVLAPLRNNREYRIAQKVVMNRYSVPSLWRYTSILTDYPEPAKPFLYVIGEESKARMRIDLEPNPNSGEVLEEFYTVYRRVEDGPWEVIRGTDGAGLPIIPVTRRATVYDNEAPIMKQLYYMAVAQSDDAATLVPSAYSAVIPAFLDVRNVWLKDPLDVNRNASFPVSDKWLERSVRRSRAVHDAFGRRLPRVLRGSAEGERFTVKFLVIGEGRDLELEEMLDTPHPLLLQTPGKSWYVELAGDFTISDHLWDELRDEEPVWVYSVPFVETDKP